VYVGRFDPATGVLDRGQTFTARLPNTKGNSVFIDQGGIDADSSGRVYLTGISAWGLPLTSDYIPGEYTGGAYALVLSPNMATRELCVRLAFGYGRTISVHSNKRWAFGGYANGNKEYLANPIQTTKLSITTNKWDGWFGYFNTILCPTTSTTLSSMKSGMWNATSTWQCGQIPTLLHQVKIENGHTVTLPTNYTGNASTIDLQGILLKEQGSQLNLKR
jgi:hypothetical protein